MKTVIIGGVAGGAAAATRIRRLDEKAEIILIERSGYISYANCGLPYYLGGVIESRSDLSVQTVEGMKERYRIDVRIHQEMIHINRDRHTVTVHDLLNGTEYEESYDRLLLSTGAHPVIPDMEGVNLPGVFTLRTVENTFAIDDYIDNVKAKKAVVIGGGFIGLEMAENLIHRGMKVNLLQRGNQVMNILDEDMASFVHTTLKENRVNLTLNADAQKIEQDADGLLVSLKDGCRIKADLVILAIGVIPETSVARDAGLTTGTKGALVVDDQMRTIDPDIFAVGDCVETVHLVNGAKVHIALAGPAVKQARVAADVISGKDTHYKGQIGSSVMKLFDQTVSACGMSENQAKRSGIACDSIVLTPSDHASYYPDASVLIMKLVYEKDTMRLLGVQIIGEKGVEKRVDVLACAIYNGMSVDELWQMDLCYAPPYSSAKDPVNVAGAILDNIAEGVLQTFDWKQLELLMKDPDAQIVDVRTQSEYETMHIKGMHIPLDELRDRIHEIPKDKTVYVVCQSGLRSYVACRILHAYGYECRSLSGGLRFAMHVLNEMHYSRGTHPCGMDRA